MGTPRRKKSVTPRKGPNPDRTYSRRMPPTEKQTGSALTATPSRGHRREVLEDIDRSVVLQFSLDPAEGRALQAMPTRMGP